MGSPLLPGFPVVIEIPVAWGEMDSFAHVNNVAYFRYFESARIVYFERIDAMVERERSGCGPILAETYCRFRTPLRYPDRLEVGTRVSNLGADRFTMEYALASTTLGRIAAEQRRHRLVRLSGQCQGKYSATLRERIDAIERMR
jgi:acyl-CoA thioester hydrolase